MFPAWAGVILPRCVQEELGGSVPCVGRGDPIQEKQIIFMGKCSLRGQG